MGARGPHDDPETAKAVVRAACAEFSLKQDPAATRRAYIAERVEYVTRDGVFHDADRWQSEIQVQLGKWKLNVEIEDLIDAGDGALIALVKAERHDRETGKCAWRAWPAIVLRVKDGRFVFFEGYVDRRKALSDLGLGG